MSDRANNRQREKCRHGAPPGILGDLREVDTPFGMIYVCPLGCGFFSTLRNAAYKHGQPHPGGSPQSTGRQP
jgi:hypothetical protein